MAVDGAPIRFALVERKGKGEWDCRSGSPLVERWESAGGSVKLILKLRAIRAIWKAREEAP